MPKPSTPSGYMKDTEGTDVSDTTTQDKPVNDVKDGDKSDAVKQALEQAQTPQDSHDAYLQDLERLHRESEVDPNTGRTRYTV